jgi:tRNA(Ile)-lysidine synthase
VAIDADADTIAVGHNADDQAETVLMHFLRGSGVSGLRGMLPKTLLSSYRLSGAWESGKAADGEKGPWLIRPLLATPRAAIEAYCTGHSLRPRFDRSNEDTTFYRNRLRHELLPILEDYNPQIRELLAHTAEVLAGDHEVLRTAVDGAWEQVVDPHPQPLSLRGRGARDEVYLDLVVWRALPLGLQRATIREAIHRLRASLRNINWEHVERAVCQGWGNGAEGDPGGRPGAGDRLSHAAPGAGGGANAGAAGRRLGARCGACPPDRYSAASGGSR